MRIRTIKPEFWRSSDIAELDVATRLLYIGLWSYVDDYGVGRDEERLIQADIFPLDPFTEASVRVHGGLTELSNRGLITRFEGPDGRRYLQVNSWDSHQRVNRPTRSTFPRYDAETCRLTEGSLSPHGALTEGSLLEQGNKGTREQGIKGSREGVQGEVAPAASDEPKASRKRSARNKTGTRIPDDWHPTPDLIAWTRTNAPAAANDREVDRFRDYWASTPGAKGRKTSWDATWRNWARKTQDDHDARTRGTYRNQAQIVQDMRAQAAHATEAAATATITSPPPLRLLEGDAS